jgi:hypothetical protein
MNKDGGLAHILRAIAIHQDFHQDSTHMERLIMLTWPQPDVPKQCGAEDVVERTIWIVLLGML